MKTKLGLASTTPSVISYSNKTKGNGPHFLLELVVDDLYALKLRGGTTRLHTCYCRDPARLVLAAWLPSSACFLSPLASA